MTHEDLYAHTLATNFGTNSFDIEPPDREQEYFPINHSPTLEISKNNGGAPVEQTTVPNEKTPAENGRSEIDAIDNYQELQHNPRFDAEKLPENTKENLVTTWSEDNDEI